ncbi:MAG: transcription elongation factor GreA [Patescibacteria group bacterium]|nr:transcription elongation factor GreA [Patescibacteria group bacterium]
MSDEKYFTPEGLEKIKKELNDLKTVKRREITERIEEALKLGDLSENAEYQEAKDEQGMNEAKIRELEEVIKNAVIISGEKGKKKCIEVGCTVHVKFDGQEKEFTIVGPSEADPLKGFISNESPAGEAFLGKKVGDKVNLDAPAGIIEYKILDVK